MEVCLCGCRGAFLLFLWFESKRGRMATEAAVNWAIKDGKQANGGSMKISGEPFGPGWFLGYRG